MRIYAISDIGQKRKNNEDGYLVQSTEFYVEGHTKKIYVLAVADGMGGHEAGEIASAMAIERIATAPFLYFRGGTDAVVNLIHFINRKILEKSREMNKKMGTTLVLGIIDDYNAHFFNVGDSRAYLYRYREGLKRITKDHSVVQELIDKGEITEEESMTHPERNKITMALGTKEHIKPDVYSVSLNKGDILLMCSDGVHDLIKDEELENIIAKTDKLAEIPSKIVALANERGGKDNITVIVGRA